MRKRGKGLIILTSSTAGIMGYPLRSPYAAAKWAIVGICKTLAMELGSAGIRVNAICPGAVETDMLREITGGEIPKHAMPVEDIAKVAVFLASDESRAITGTAIDAYGRGNPLFGVSPSVRRPK